MLNKNIDEIIKRCGNTTIVAATKYNTSDALKELLDKGINNFGENRALDFLEKYQNLKEYDIVWHFIGHLQTNKVSSVINKISYLHSLDSLKLARYIERYRLNPLDCFVELNLSDSKTKYGIKECELESFLNELKQFKNINVVGLMAMTEEDMTDSEKQLLFRKLYQLKEKYQLKYISAGMSDDYMLALQEHTNFVRLGRILWKECL